MKEGNNLNTNSPSQKLIGKFEELYKEYDRHDYTKKERQNAQDSFKQKVIDKLSNELKGCGLNISFVYDSKNKKFQVDLHNISQEKFEELRKQISVDKSDELATLNSMYLSKRFITAAGEELNELNKKFNEQLEVLNEQLDENFNEYNKNSTQKKVASIAQIIGEIMCLAGILISLSGIIIIPGAAF